MCNYIVTNQEIERAEQDIFKNGQHFNKDQKTFLKCLDSCHLQAYAGTGKTSAIVGKLHVLAQKDVWKNGRGICVISHTNVAVDEIKKHVARHYPAIMEYPNFVGTIQEFANKFLFIPYLASYGLHIKFQDNSRYNDYKNELEDQLIVQRITNKLTQLNHGPDGARAKEEFFKRFRTLHLNSGKLYVEDKKGELMEFSDLKTKQVPQGSIVAALSILIKKQHEKGSFLFVESFVHGYEYLKHNPILKDIISQRFQFVFLDEAQDCSEIQLKVLNELFRENSKTIFQQIGDVNQAITETIWKAHDPWLYLRQSMRFGQNITDFINKFQVDTGLGVTGCGETTKMFLIVYDSGKEKDVIAKFAEKIETEQMPLNKGEGYFAISHQHAQLEKYFPDYSEKIAKSKNSKKSYRFETDIEYLDLIKEDTIRGNGSHFVSDMLFHLLYKHYKESSNSWSELRDLLRNSDKADSFKRLVIEICNDVLLNKYSTAPDKLESNLNKILGKDKIVFSRSGDASNLISNSTTVSDNRFMSSNGIKINIGTIHSVKGQTHDATLLFSNKENKKQDIQHVFDNTQKRTPEYKRLLYVASSRSKYLFAFAIENDAYNSLSDKSIFSNFNKLTI